MEELIAALDEALKYERTLADCFAGYHAYFGALRIHRLERWMAWNACESRKRCDALQLLICRLGAMPSADRYEFDLVELADADRIGDVFDYFETTLSEARAAYAAAGDAARAEGCAEAGHLCGEHQRAVEDTLRRIGAKAGKVKLIGPEAYLAHHMHEMG
jgi:hypothetical protein